MPALYFQQSLCLISLILLDRSSNQSLLEAAEYGAVCEQTRLLSFNWGPLSPHGGSSSAGRSVGMCWVPSDCDERRHYL
ncbi:hypothetical protein BJX65DRAFT_269755 [Aspergillus insuetus]